MSSNDTYIGEKPLIEGTSEEKPALDGTQILPCKRKIFVKNDKQSLLEKAIFGENHKEIKYAPVKKHKGNIILYDGKEEAFLKKIGSGANGTVMQVTFFHNNSKIAIKIGEKNNILREYKCISFLNKNGSSKNVINNVAPYVEYNDLAALILPSYDTDLASVIADTNQSLSNDHIKYILYNILNGLAHTHALGIIHADLKPANILVQVNPLECTLADYGLAQKKNEGSLASHIVSRWYRAPEIIKKEKYSYMIDIWSFGCILYELVTGEVCFKGTACGDLSPIDNKNIPLDIKDGMMDLIHNNDANKNLALICIMKNYDTELVKLFKQCTEIDPTKRITAIGALNHNFFMKI